MPELVEMQGGFVRALDGEAAAESLLTLFAGDACTIEGRLAVYRGNLRGTVAHALAAAYPVIARVVGAEFFEAMAREYAREVPSTSGDLNQYGMQLAEFLAGFAPVRELPYLPDLARLEWVVHRAHYGADVDALDVTRLATVPPAQQPSLRLRLNPLCACFESRFPLARIWEIHQQDFAGEFGVDFEGGPFYALVLRPRFRAHAIAIRAGEYAFLGATAAGATLNDALNRALHADPEFDLDTALRRWVETLVVTDFF